MIYMGILRINRDTKRGTTVLSFDEILFQLVYDVLIIVSLVYGMEMIVHVIFLSSSSLKYNPYNTVPVQAIHDHA